MTSLQKEQKTTGIMIEMFCGAQKVPKVESAYSA